MYKVQATSSSHIDGQTNRTYKSFISVEYKKENMAQKACMVWYIIYYISKDNIVYYNINNINIKNMHMTEFKNTIKLYGPWS